MARRKGRTAAQGPDPLDLHIGQRIRRCRLMLRLRQKTIADQVGVSFQAIQKYESGAVRVATSTLFRIARRMGVTLDYFVAELPAEEDSAAPPLSDDDEFIIARPGPRSSAAMQEEEWAALHAVGPLMALPPDLRDAVIGHIIWLVRTLGKGRDVAADNGPRHG
jgi:transcriptional regulator with XRE-family HTH domain